ncbi:MAG: L,D-transpeptidase family protein [Paracoccaceae bacterium]
MTISNIFSRRAFIKNSATFSSLMVFGVSTPAIAQTTAFMQAVAESAARDKAITAFYKSTGYAPIWTGRGNRHKSRRQALLKALASASDHGLPHAAYNSEFLKANLRRIKSERDLGRIEVQLSKLFLQYARDIQTGVLTPHKIDEDIARKVPLRDRLQLLMNFSNSSPGPYIRKLVPTAPEYTRLMKQKLVMERLLANGGWGAKVPGKKLKLGKSGANVVALRNRLIVMGYLRRNASQIFDAGIQKAVQQFQLSHGLNPDGVAGPTTLKEINVSAERRLASIIVAMERERWMNMPRGERHIWVNLADFRASIIDNGKVTFQTRSVVGADEDDRRSPEFSDVMEHMVINPTWNVPKSIAIEEYLPLMQEDPYAVEYLEMTDEFGQLVSRDTVDFSELSEDYFPYDLKQPPSRENALGLVKFMFPNKHNIYLHDTPAKNLFARESRAFSHGCIRLRDPFDFAYTLLRRQMNNPEAFFQERLATGKETVVPLKQKIPVHLVYRTAITTAKGSIEYRRDVYGRDRKIFAALQRAGVVLQPLQS